MYPGQLDSGGLTLLDQYDGDAAAQHADDGLVVYLAVMDFVSGGWDADPADVATLEAFTRDEGGGLYGVGEYRGGGIGQPQLHSLNAIAAPRAPAWSWTVFQLQPAEPYGERRPSAMVIS